MVRLLFFVWMRMGQRFVLIMVLFGFAIGSEFHGSEGSVAHLLRELQSKSSYLPPFLYRIVLPVSMGASSKSTNLQVHLSRMISPSALAPHGPTKNVPELPPPRQRNPTFEHHGKLPRTSAPGPLPLPTNRAASSLPVLLPLNLAPVQPRVQGPVASSPENAPSSHEFKEDKQS